MLDVLDLQQDVAEQFVPLGDAPGGENQQQGQAAESTTKVKEEEKEKVWVERDKCVSAAVRNATAQLEAFVTKSKTQLHRQLKAEKEILADADDSFNKSFAGEIKMLRVRLEAYAARSYVLFLLTESTFSILRCAVSHRSDIFVRKQLLKLGLLGCQFEFGAPTLYHGMCLYTQVAFWCWEFVDTHTHTHWIRRCSPSL